MSIQERIRYGAAELKSSYNRHLGSALLMSVGIHLVLIGVYVILQGESVDRRRLIAIRDWNWRAPGGEPTEPPPVVPTNVDPPAVGGGIRARAGNPIPVPDAVIPPDETPFAKLDEITLAAPTPGDGTGFLNPDDDPLRPIDIGGGVDVQDVEKEPGIEEFVPDSEEPKFDYDALHDRLVYPDVAERNGIEGTVVVRVLVDRTGRPTKYRVEMSDSKLLEQAAIDAVMATQFTPGLQNKVPIQLWVSIPIRFELP